jgi:arylsulfatase A-like enzyme
MAGGGRNRGCRGRFVLQEVAFRDNLMPVPTETKRMNIETAQPLPESSELHNQSKSPPKTCRAMVERRDQGVGRIMQALQEKGISKTTIVIFASDNGATWSGSNGPLSGFKGSTFEGGIRVT